jgi:hypothetical protein
MFARLDVDIDPPHRRGSGVRPGSKNVSRRLIVSGAAIDASITGGFDSVAVNCSPGMWVSAVTFIIIIILSLVAYVRRSYMPERMPSRSTLGAQMQAQPLCVDPWSLNETKP